MDFGIRRIVVNRSRRGICIECFRSAHRGLYAYDVEDDELRDGRVVDLRMSLENMGSLLK